MECLLVLIREGFRTSSKKNSLGVGNEQFEMGVKQTFEVDLFFDFTELRLSNSEVCSRDLILSTLVLGNPAISSLRASFSLTKCCTSRLVFSNSFLSVTKSLMSVLSFLSLYLELLYLFSS